jgi:hypothetical protein
MTQLTSSFAGVEIDEKKARLIKYAILGVCFAVAAPVALAVLKGVVALAVAGAITTGSIFFAPVIARKMAIQRIKAVVAEAQKNPIETLQAEFIQMQADVNELETGVKEYGAAVSDFEQQTSEYRSKYPEDARLFEDQLAAVKAEQEIREEKYQVAVTDLGKMADVVERAKALWKMAKVSERMNEIEGRKSEDVFARISVETSLETVRQAAHKSVAEARIALLKKNAQGAQPGLAGVSQAKLAPPQQPQDINLIGEVRQAQPVAHQ